MNYTVKYRRLGSGDWHEIPNVVEDAFVEGLPIRSFVVETAERHEVPTTGVEFWFSKERSELISARRAAEAASRSAAEMEQRQ